MTRIGVIDLESFYPAKDRFELAMTINALIASPGFEVWIQGEPLDVAAFLRTSSGKPRVSIFSIAHLDDAQRMFFVALLLNAVAGWMRAQTGTSSLRAMVYMDEIFGFFPPTANPPSKGPLLTLLEAGARGRRRRGAGDAEPGRSRLQGAVEHRHLVARAPADRTRQGARCSTDSKAPAITAASIARRSIGCSRASPAACSSCATCTRTA